jgi:hypothetical protein
MEKRNIDGFKLEHPGQDFPVYRSLSSDETIHLRQRLKGLVGLSNESDDLTLAYRIRSQSKCIAGALNAENKDFNLFATLRNLNINPQEKVYLNFCRFDDIDEMSIIDVSANFRYVWYPVSDDIDIFDSTLAWIVSISHDGEVSLAKMW